MPWILDLPKAEWVDVGAPELDGLVREVCDRKIVALDTETTGLSTWGDKPIFWSLAFDRRRIAMPIATLPCFEAAFKDPSKIWVFANAKFDVHMLANVGMPIAGKYYDVQVMHGLLYDEQPHDLAYLGRTLLAMEWKDLFNGWNKRTHPTAGDFLNWVFATNPQKLIEYASNDTYATMKIYDLLKKQLEAAGTVSLYPQHYGNQWDIFSKIEAPFTKVLWKCERRGVLIDAEYMESRQGPILHEIERVEREANALAGRMINPGSNKQLQEYFFGELKLQPTKYTKGGKTGVKQPSVDESFLDHYADTVPMAKLCLEYRELTKTSGTYVESTLELIDSNNRIHTRFNQTPRTGRLSSSSPNLQNWPKPETDKFKLRGAIVAPEGFHLIVADYEALEMRLLAAASLETDMIQIFLDGKDIHMGNAEMVFGAPYADLKTAKKMNGEIKEGKRPESDYDVMLPGGFTVKQCVDFRNDIKAVGFGANYGMKEQKLARSLGRTVPEAKKLLEDYMGRYPAVKRFFNEAVDECRQLGFAFTVLGRRRFLPEILSHSDFDRWQAERQAGNCVDFETEALTQRGWVRGPELNPKDILLTKNAETEELEWQPMTDLCLYPDYDGPLVEFRSKTFSAVSTPEHRWLVYDKQSGQNICRQTKNLSRHGDHRIHRTGEYQGAASSIYSNEFVELIGWVLTDGYYKKAKTYNTSGVVICQSERANPEKVAQIDRLFQRMGQKASRRVRNECAYWAFFGANARMIKDLFPARELTHNFLTKLTKDQVRILLSTMLLGDGCSTPDHESFVTRSRSAADAFQTLCMLGGFATTCKWRDMSKYTPRSSKLKNIPKMTGIYVVSILRRRMVQVVRHQVVEFSAARGVWCPVVPNTYFVARREGKVFITGNTQIQGSAADVVKMAMIHCDEAELDKRFDCHMNLQVHDEMMFECPDEHVAEVSPEIREWMEHSLPSDLAVPLTISMGTGSSWISAK